MTWKQSPVHRAYTFLPLIASAIALVLAAGCSIEMNPSVDAQLGTHSVTVKPGAMTVSQSSSISGKKEVHTFECGDNAITISNEFLTVNHVKYGKLEPGESVEVNHGEVLISGVARKGVPLTPEEMPKPDRAETTANLDQYEVTIVPGASTSTTSSFMGSHTLKVGRVKVTVQGNQLSVDNKSYGKLLAGDTIRVENGVVYVSDKLRKPVR